MAKLSTILYLIQFICPYVLGLDVKGNDFEVSKNNRAEKLCEFNSVHQIQPPISKIKICRKINVNSEIVVVGSGEQYIFILLHI